MADKTAQIAQLLHRLLLTCLWLWWEYAYNPESNKPEIRREQKKTTKTFVKIVLLFEMLILKAPSFHFVGM